MQSRLEKLIEKEDFITFFDYFFMVLGAIFLASGVMFFIAYNWQVLGKFFKFFLVEAGIVGSFLLSYRLDEKSIGFKSSILVGSFLIGVLMALFGQVYQSGAESYELFLYWAVIVLPIAILSRFSWIWVFEVVLLNFAFYTMDWYYIGLHRFEVETMSIINGIIFVVWSILSDKVEFLNQKYATRVIATLAIFWMGFAMQELIFSRYSADGWIAIFSILLAIFTFYRYRYKELDIYILSILVLCLNLIVASAILRFSGSFSGSIITGAIVMIPVGFFSIAWLKNLGEQDEK